MENALLLIFRFFLTIAFTILFCFLGTLVFCFFVLALVLFAVGFIIAVVPIAWSASEEYM